MDAFEQKTRLYHNPSYDQELGIYSHISCHCRIEKYTHTYIYILYTYWIIFYINFGNLDLKIHVVVPEQRKIFLIHICIHLS